MSRVSPGVSRDRVPVLAGRCDPLVERAIRDLYLRFYKFSPVQNITQTTTVAAEPKKLTGAKGIDAYTMVFTKDGFVSDNELSPRFTVNTLRDGYKPYKVSLTAEEAPVGTLSVNFLLEGVAMLNNDLTLAAGQLGPVFSNDFALPDAIPADKGVKMKITVAASARGVVGEVVMKKVV